MRFDVPYVELVRVANERWFAKHNAVLITLRFVYHDSGGASPGDLGILYDYERGELGSCGDPSAWFVWAADPTQRNTTCNDLAKVADTLYGS